MNKLDLSCLNNCEPCTIKIRGKVAFSHIARKVCGSEFEKYNAIRRSKGLPSHKAPYSALTLEHATLLESKQLDSRVRNFFTDYLKNNQQKENNSYFHGISFTKLLPPVIATNELNSQPIMYNRNTPLPGELKLGLDVTLYINVYQGKYGPGFGISYVVVNEPIKFNQDIFIWKPLTDKMYYKYSAPALNTTTA